MKWFLGVIGASIAIILLVVFVFRRPNEPTRITTEPGGTTVEEQLHLPDYADSSAVVRYTIQGKVVGEEQYRSIRISVSQSSRKVEVLQGYDQTVIDTKEYPNKQTAFDNFLQALDKAGYSNVREDISSDERGVCPKGRRYVFDIIENGDTMQRTWTTSCGSRTGSFAGNRSTIESLFRDQIPDYRKTVATVKL